MILEKPQADKTANQLWKESGTTQTFKEWVSQVKQDSIFVKNAALEKIVSDAKSSSQEEVRTVSSNGFLGLSKNVIIISGLLVTAAVLYKIYKK